jgi:hypothetical protein
MEISVNEHKRVTKANGRNVLPSGDLMTFHECGLSQG